MCNFIHCLHRGDACTVIFYKKIFYLKYNKQLKLSRWYSFSVWSNFLLLCKFAYHITILVNPQYWDYFMEEICIIPPPPAGAGPTSTDERVQIDWQCPLSGVLSIMMVNSAQSGAGGRVHALPLSLYIFRSQAKLWCMLQLRGKIHSFYFSSTLFMGPRFVLV